MRYVDRVLLPGEEVIFRGRVSSALYVPGLLCLGLSVLAAMVLPGITRGVPGLDTVFRKMIYHVPLLDYTANIVTLCCFGIGVVLLVHAYVVNFTTELAVTNRRVIAKFGVANTTTTELDRFKIAGVIIRRSPWGKMLNYGRVTLRGYAGDISNLPPLSAPYELQKMVNSRVRG